MASVVHEGRNVKRLREILGVKQEALASELGINQQKMSYVEQKEKVEEELLQQIADILKVPVEAIKNFDEEAAVNIISTTFDNGAFLNTGHNPAFNINPIEKWMEALKENKELYERLLKAEQDKIALYEKLLQDKQ